MRVLVLVKHLPDHTGVRRFTDRHLVDREAASGILGELDEYAMEQAVRLRSAVPTSIVSLCLGSPGAEVALVKTLQLGADEAFLLTDPAVRGSDALTTSLALASAVRAIESRQGAGFDLIFCGMSSTDSYMGTQPAMLAERLGVGQLTFATTLEVDPAARTARITRLMDGRTDLLEADFPAVVSVTDQAPAGRTPTIKDIIAARAKPITRLDLEAIGLPRDRVGSTASRARIQDASLRPARPIGTIITDDGTGNSAQALADFLLAAAPR